MLSIFLEDYFILVQRKIRGSPDPTEILKMVGSNIEKFILPSIDERRKSGDK